MSITQNLKILNKPINELAMLPQETIMQMAQMGQIPTAFVAPILSEKAQQAQAGANAAAMMAQQQLPPTTVIEDIIAQNAANESKEAMPEMQMPEDSGIAALPVNEGMVPEFAGGGIVAFEAGGGVDYSQFGEYGEELKRQEALRKLYLGENEALKAEREGMDAAAREQRAMRLLEAGLGIMGGDSPYALQNIARGSQAALKGYAEDVAGQRKRKSELAGMERAEKAKVLESAMGEVRAREKNTPEDIRTARAIQEEARAAKKPVPTLAQALKSIERTPQTTTLEAAYVRSKADAAKAVGELVNSSVFNSEVRSIEKKQGKAAAEEYKRRRIAETVALYPGVDPASVMASIGGGRAPSSAPSGTVDKNNPLLR